MIGENPRRAEAGKPRGFREVGDVAERFATNFAGHCITRRCGAWHGAAWLADAIATGAADALENPLPERAYRP